MTQTVPDISPLMPMHQDPLLVALIFDALSHQKWMCWFVSAWESFVNMSPFVLMGACYIASALSKYNIDPSLTHWGPVIPYSDTPFGLLLALVMACCLTAPSHYLNQSWVLIGSALVTIMVCCLTAPSHYLNQCWLIITHILCISPESNFTKKYSWTWSITCLLRLHL